MFIRVPLGKAPREKEKNPARKSALELSIGDYADSKNDLVINPAIGTTFDSLQEAYDFYNLYSWEVGFEVRYGKSHLNVERTKCMQEIVCTHKMHAGYGKRNCSSNCTHKRER